MVCMRDTARTSLPPLPCVTVRDIAGHRNFAGRVQNLVAKKLDIKSIYLSPKIDSQGPYKFFCWSRILQKNRLGVLRDIPRNMSRKSQNSTTERNGGGTTCSAAGLCRSMPGTRVAMPYLRYRTVRGTGSFVFRCGTSL